MKQKILIFIAITFMFFYSNAQTTPPAIQWQKSLGGNKVDKAYSIQQTNDGGYIVAGYSISHDGDITVYHDTTYYDYWVVKIDTIGNIKWQKSLGGTNSDVAKSIQQTNDGGYIVAGYSMSNDGDVTSHHYNSAYDNSDYWVVKLDSVGNIQWQKSLGGTEDDRASSIQQTNDGGYIVAGSSYSNDGDVTGHHGTISYSDCWVVKLDTSGNIQWQKSLGGTEDDNASSIQQTNDGGYIVVCSSNSNGGDVTGNHGSRDYWVVKLDTVGNIKWQKSIGGTNGDYAYSIQQTNDGGYIVTGITGSNDGDVSGHHYSAYGNWDYWVVKLDTVGNIKWQKCLGGSDNDYAYSVKQTNDGGYIIAGSGSTNDGDITGNHGSSDYWIVKLDTAGNIQWQKSLGGSENDEAYSIQQTLDGGYIIAGLSSSNDGDVFGNHDTSGLTCDYWIVKLSPTLGIEEHIILSNVSIYPNPTNSNFTIKLPQNTRYITITNSLGQLVEKRIINNQTEQNFEIKNNGMYFVQITTDKEIITKKVIVNK